MGNYCYRFIVLLCVCLSGLTALPSIAQKNLVVFDREITITKGTQHWKAREGLPPNWVDPVDYRKGVCHVEWEILEAPEAASGHTLQIGWTFPGNTEKNYQLLRFKYLRLKSRLSSRVHQEDMPDEVPVPYLIPGKRYHTIHLMDDGLYFWPKVEKAPKDYSKGINGMMAFLRSKEWKVVGPPGGKIVLRIRMTLVPEGGRFIPAGVYGGLRSDSLKELSKVAEWMQKREPGKALQQAEKELKSENAARVMEAKSVIKAMKIHVSEQSTTAEKLWLVDHVAAYQMLSELRAQFKGTTHGDSINATLKTWGKDKGYRKALIADRAYQKMKKTAEQLIKRMGGGTFEDVGKRKMYAREAKQLIQFAQMIEKKYPGSPASQKAQQLLVSIGLTDQP